MPPTRHNEPIAAWQDGDRVSGFALLTRKELRQDRNGRSYLDLELADRSSSIATKAWADSPALEADVEARRFVRFTGTVSRYRDHLQLNLLDLRAATEGDRAEGFDESLLIPSSPEDLDELWRGLHELLDRHLERPALRRLADETLAVHGAALREHPAARSMHHAYRGGLLEHVVSMLELAVAVIERYPEVDRDLLLVGVLFHDLGKLQELGAMPANDYTTDGQFVGHVVLGRDLLRERCAAIPDFPEDARLHLEHLVLSHQGRLEFGSPVEPKTATALALHFLDDLDSKLNQLRGARSRGTGFQYVRGLGRWLWVDDGEPDQEG